MRKLRHLVLASALFGVIAALPGAALAQSAAAPTMDPGALAGPNANPATKIALDQRLGEYVPKDATFTNDSGEKVTLGDLLAKRPVLLIPMFYRCDTACALETDNLLKLLVKEEGQNRLRQAASEEAGINMDQFRRDHRLLVGRDFDVVMLSIHPHETPDLAKTRRVRVEETFAQGWEKLSPEEQKSAMESVQRGFHYLVGTPDQVHKVTDAIGFTFYYDEKKDQMNHPAASVLLTTDGQISGYVTGTDYNTKVLANGVDLAAKNEVGVEGDTFLFGCIHVDPVTGKVQIIFQRVLMVGCVLTVLVLGASIVVMNRKNPTRKPFDPAFDGFEGNDPKPGGSE